MNTVSWGKSKLVLLGSVLFLSSFFFGGQASAETCTWTASSSVIIGTNGNWDNGSGASCTLTADDNLVFDGSVTSSVATATGDVEFNSISIESNYTGTINFSNVNVSTTANFIQNGGLINFIYTSGSKNFFVGGNMGIASSTDIVNTDGRGIFRVVGNLTVSSTFSSMVTTTNIISIGGNLLVPGTFAFKQTVFTGSSKTIGGAGLIDIASSTVSGSLSLTSNVTSSLNLTISSLGSLNLGTSTLYAAGGITNNNFLFQTGGSVIMTGTNSLISNGGNTTLYNLVINGSATLYGTVTTTNVLTVGSVGTLSGLNGTIILTATGTPFIVNGTFSAGSSTIQYENVGTVIIASTTFYNLTVSSTLAGFDSAANTTVQGFLTVNGGTLDFSDAYNVLIGGTLLNNAIVTSTGSSLVTMTGVESEIGGTGTTTLHFLVVNNYAYLGNDLILNGSLSADYFDLNSYNLSVVNGISVSSSLLSTGGGSITVTGADATIDGAGTVSVENLYITDYTTLIGNSSITASSSLVVNSGAFLNAGGYSLNFSGTGVPFIINGTFAANTSTVVYSGATSNIASTTYYNLTVNGTDTLVGNVTTTNVLTINSGKTLIAGTNTLTLSGTGTPLVNNGTFTANTSTVIYSGVGTTYISPTSSYYNLTINSTNAAATTLTATINVSNIFTINGLFYADSTQINLSGTGTPLVVNGTFNEAYGMIVYTGSGAIVTPETYYNLTIASPGSLTLGGNVTTTNALGINSGATLNAGSHIVRLAGSGTPLVIGGTFTASTSEVMYTNTGSVTVKGAVYYKLTLGVGTYTLSSNATTTNTFVNNGAFTLNSYNLVASGDYTNNGTVSGISYVKKQATGSGLSNVSYTSGSSNGTGNSASINIIDYTANDDGTTLDTISVSLAASNYSDSEDVTLTETGVATGIFSGTVPFFITNAKTSNNSRLDVSGNGTLTLSSYSNGYGVSSLTNSSASYSGSTYSSGGGTGGGSSAQSVSSITGAVSLSISQTTSQTVSLNLSATNATQVAISEDPGFAGASWDTYTPTKPFTLSNGAGEKTIYVKFRSAAGGVTSVYKVNVTLKSDYVPAPVVTPAVTTPAAVVTAVAQFEVSNPDSKVVISPVKTLVYKPNSVVKYTYAYKNEAAKTVKVKVVRSVVNAKGKVITKVTGSASITKGKTFKFNASSPLSNKVADGKYTVKVQILDFKTGKLVDENSFGITVKKPAPVVKKPVVKASVKTVAKPAVKK